MIVRTWNVFHGNTSPPRRQAYLREMVELVAAGRPTAVCLQEVPVWALGRLGAWASMQAVTDRTRRERLPLLGRRLTALHTGVFRSAFTGQGNAILLPPDATVRDHRTLTLNTNPFCEEQGRRLGLDGRTVRRWQQERRICQLVKFELPGRQRVLVANLHATTYPQDPRLADAELRRATSFVERQAEVEEAVVVAGDFNLRRDQSQTVEALVTAPPESRWLAAGPGIDHVLVRGAAISAARAWPEEERRHGGRLLSDHAPVEVVLNSG